MVVSSRKRRVRVVAAGYLLLQLPGLGLECDVSDPVLPEQQRRKSGYLPLTTLHRVQLDVRAERGEAGSERPHVQIVESIHTRD